MIFSGSGSEMNPSLAVEQSRSDPVLCLITLRSSQSISSRFRGTSFKSLLGHNARSFLNRQDFIRLQIC